jgi:Lar family restriction alleviation protein
MPDVTMKVVNSSISKKPCPFCNNIDTLELVCVGEYYLVECNKCETSGPVASKEDKAVERWNRRF